MFEPFFRDLCHILVQHFPLTVRICTRVGLLEGGASLMVEMNLFFDSCPTYKCD